MMLQKVAGGRHPCTRRTDGFHPWRVDHFADHNIRARSPGTTTSVSNNVNGDWFGRYPVADRIYPPNHVVSAVSGEGSSDIRVSLAAASAKWSRTSAILSAA
jgi:hypothetical protein